MKRLKIEKSVCTQYEMRLEHEEIVSILRETFLDEYARRGWVGDPKAGDIGIEVGTGQASVSARIYIITKEFDCREASDHKGI